MSTADRVAAKINRSHRFLKPLWERGRGHEVLFQSGTARINSRTLSVDGTDFVDFATTSFLGLIPTPPLFKRASNRSRAADCTDTSPGLFPWENMPNWNCGWPTSPDYRGRMSLRA